MAPARPTRPAEQLAARPRRRRGLVRVPLLLAALCTGPATGCNMMSRMFVRGEPVTPLPRMAEGNLGKDQIVAHLNQNIRKLHGWRSSNVTITAKQPGSIPISLTSSIAVERPRNFRMRARSLIMGDVTDFGSNEERFWFWMRDSPQKVVFTAKHENVHLVQARMHIPFDPDWLIESLGVVEIDPNAVTLERTDPTGVVVDLFEERVLANGQRARMATTVDTKHGLIVGRTLYDPRGRLVARATIQKHRVHRGEGPEGDVVMPHEIKLEWPNEKTTLVLAVGRLDVNPSIPRPTFTLPTIPKYAIYEVDAGMAARQPRHRAPVAHRPPSRAALGFVEPPRAGERNFKFEDELLNEPINSQTVGLQDGFGREPVRTASAVSDDFAEQGEFDPSMFEDASFEDAPFEGRSEPIDAEFRESDFVPPTRANGPSEPAFEDFGNDRFGENRFEEPSPGGWSNGGRSRPEPPPARSSTPAWYD